MKKCEGDQTTFNCKFCPYVNNRMDRLQKHRIFGTPVDKEKAMKSIVWHNTRKAGFTPPHMFKLRKKSHYSMSPETNKDI